MPIRRIQLLSPPADAPLGPGGGKPSGGLLPIGVRHAPRTLLSSEQRTRLFAIPTASVEMLRHSVFGAGDLALVRTKRRSINRLGFAVQLYLLRYPGLGMGPAEQPPGEMVAFVATVPDDLLADVAPLGWEHIGPTGDYL